LSVPLWPLDREGEGGGQAGRERERERESGRQGDRERGREGGAERKRGFVTVTLGVPESTSVAPLQKALKASFEGS